MTTEEKAKAYDEALEMATKFYNANTNEGYRQIFEDIFPELKESEDEKIKKDILRSLDRLISFYEKDDKSDFCARDFMIEAVKKQKSWLEKQYTDPNKEYWRGYREGKQEVLDKYTELEKRGGKKSIDSMFEIKPKFKVGDTIREKKTGNFLLVNSIEDFGYTLHYKNCNANGCTMSFKYEDNYELVEQKPIECNIIDKGKELSLSLQIQAYLNTASDELYAKGKPLYSEKRIEDIHNCMKMWQKLHNNYFYGNQKPVEWSKEDNLMLQRIIQDLVSLSYECQVDFNDKLNWLKSLRPQTKEELDSKRIELKTFIALRWGCDKKYKEKAIEMIDSLYPHKQWKPSEEQMNAVEKALSLAKNCGEEYSFDLRTLLEQLKAL